MANKVSAQAHAQKQAQGGLYPTHKWGRLALDVWRRLLSTLSLLEESCEHEGVGCAEGAAHVGMHVGMHDVHGDLLEESCELEGVGCAAHDGMHDEGSEFCLVATTWRDQFVKPLSRSQSGCAAYRSACEASLSTARGVTGLVNKYSNCRGSQPNKYHLYLTVHAEIFFTLA